MLTAIARSDCVRQIPAPLGQDRVDTEDPTAAVEQRSAAAAGSDQRVVHDQHLVEPLHGPGGGGDDAPPLRESHRHHGLTRPDRSGADVQCLAVEGRPQDGEVEIRVDVDHDGGGLRPVPRRHLSLLRAVQDVDIGGDQLVGDEEARADRPPRLDAHDGGEPGFRGPSPPMAQPARASAKRIGRTRKGGLRITPGSHIRSRERAQVDRGRRKTCRAGCGSRHACHHIRSMRTRCAPSSRTRAPAAGAPRRGTAAAATGTSSSSRPGETVTLLEQDGPGLHHARLLRPGVSRADRLPRRDPALLLGRREHAVGRGAARRLLRRGARPHPARCGSALVAVNPGFGSSHGLHAYFPMPFATGARITLEHRGERTARRRATGVLVPHRLRDLRHATACRHAALPRAVAAGAPDRRGRTAPERPAARRTRIWTAPRTTSRSRPRAPGRWSACMLEINNIAGGWYGEGDDMVFVDGEAWPPSHPRHRHRGDLRRRRVPRARVSPGRTTAST